MEETATQEITRHQILAPPEGYTGPMGPIISQAVTHGNIVYVCGVVTPQVWRDPSNTTFSDVRGQTREVLERIDELLADAGTDKSKILTAQVWLADIRDFYAHNEEWNAWVDPENPPVRACIEARLVLPQLLVEVMVTAARQTAEVLAGKEVTAEGGVHRLGEAGLPAAHCAARLQELRDAGSDAAGLWLFPADRAEAVAELTAREVLPRLCRASARERPD